MAKKKTNASKVTTKTTTVDTTPETDVQEVKTQPQKETSGPSKIQQIRGNHKFRIWLIIALLILVAILFYFFEKARIGLAIAFIALLAALGFEVSQNDYDLGKLWQTKSFEQSKVTRDAGGNVLFDKLGNIVTDSTKGKEADSYN